MSDEPEQRNWLELPRDVTASILSRLGVIDILESVQKVCLLWRDICKDSSMWRSINMQDCGDLFIYVLYDLEKMCMHAVDRSNGELVDISIESFGTDELLSYISQRTKDVRRLRLVRCYSISDKGLSEAASKLSFLEELEISYYTRIFANALAVVGRCCPNLKSFKLNNMGFRHLHLEGDDGEAQAIAQNMHELRHLQLYGNKLTNSGLLSILDGCPHLESLDLRQCFNVNLKGDLEKRCAQQIKHLRRPNDSTQDYEFDATLHYGYEYEYE